MSGHSQGKDRVRQATGLLSKACRDGDADAIDRCSEDLNAAVLDREVREALVKGIRAEHRLKLIELLARGIAPGQHLI